MTTRNTLSAFQERIVRGKLTRLFLQHHGNVIANRVGQPVQAANENTRVTLVLQRSLAHGTSQYLEQALNSGVTED